MRRRTRLQAPITQRSDKMNIKELRTAAKMTQKAFAEYFGIPKRTIEDWETERRTPTAYVLELIEYKLKNEKLI